MKEIELYREVVYSNKYEGDTSIIDKHIEHLLLFDKGRTVSNIGGYQSNFITFGFYDLIEFMVNSINQVSPAKVKLNSFWLNINKGTDSNNVHNHGQSGWSAVYYHKVCCDKSPIVFHHYVPAIKCTTWPISPQNQECLFFDMSVPHSVKACGNAEHERVSIAFNFDFL